jgi:glycosyltransferase involved in cell wall biosynthesis
LISILIPSYNRDLTDLVTGLRQQAAEAGIRCEILIADDNSAAGFRERNRALAQISHVRYLQLEENIGRASIRNLLAVEARYENLLFMDADARLPEGKYLSRYAEMCGPEQVICGGTAYGSNPPDDPAYHLRWKYGRIREARTAAVRSEDPCRAFSSFQFLATRKILEKVPFDEKLKAYGHEDTVFGLELERKGIPVVHIDNALVHMGLEPVDEFLVKTRQGLENLRWLVEQERYAGLEQRVRILKTYRFVRKWGFSSCLKWFNMAGKAWMYRKLGRRNPSLRIFDLYKLCYFAALH